MNLYAKLIDRLIPEEEPEAKDLKDHMVDIDCIMTEDDYLVLNEYRMEKDSGELVSHEDLKISMEL
jgi:hypothetical protein